MKSAATQRNRDLTDHQERDRCGGDSYCRGGRRRSVRPFACAEQALFSGIPLGRAPGDAGLEKHRRDPRLHRRPSWRRHPEAAAGLGGKNVFKIKSSDEANLNQIFEAVSEVGYLIAQSYLPEATAATSGSS